jgi:hypothetical protein
MRNLLLLALFLLGILLILLSSRVFWGFLSSSVSFKPNGTLVKRSSKTPRLFEKEGIALISHLHCREKRSKANWQPRELDGMNHVSWAISDEEMAGKRAQISCPFAPYLATIAKL